MRERDCPELGSSSLPVCTRAHFTVMSIKFKILHCPLVLLYVSENQVDAKLELWSLENPTLQALKSDFTLTKVPFYPNESPSFLVVFAVCKIISTSLPQFLPQFLTFSLMTGRFCKSCKIFIYSSIQLGQEGFSLFD